MIAFDAAVLPERDRALLDLLGRTPGWTVTPSETFVDATIGAAGIRFSAERSPVLLSPDLAADYPVALATFVWHCVRFSTHNRWLGERLTTATQWQRFTLDDYTPWWPEIVAWIPLAPRDLLELAAATAEPLRADVHSDDDARRAAETLYDTITSAPTYSRVSAFLAHLDPPQRTIAHGMLVASAEIDTFWGPEQMDVWRLTLRRGDATVGFGIERGFSDGVSVDHRRLRDRGARDGWTRYGDLWLVWARRTGVIPHAVDPLEVHVSADYTAWAAVLDWLDTASDADLTAIDALEVVVREAFRAKYSSRRRDVPAEERIAAAENAIMR
jgi:hypothetical protein